MNGISGVVIGVVMAAAGVNQIKMFYVGPEVQTMNVITFTIMLVVIMWATLRQSTKEN